MQAIIGIPDSLGGQHEAQRLLFREISGVPLLLRAIATASRAGVDKVLLVFPGFIPPEVMTRVRECRIFAAGPRIECVSVPGFCPGCSAAWQQISARLHDEFLWVPWNLVTNKHSLLRLEALAEKPDSWTHAARLRREAVTRTGKPGSRAEKPQGVSVVSEDSVKTAERWLVANSGKPLDGIYTSFNRRLCRPVVRALTHTAVSPNAVTLVGLLVACLSAYCFSSGSYLLSVIGALLFFLSGLCDEVDGMLARIKFSDSAFGTWFEGSVDNLSYLLLFGGIALGLSRHRGPRELWIGAAVLGGAILSVAAVSWLRHHSTHPQQPSEYLGKMYRRLEEDRGNWISRISRNIEFLLKKGVFIHYVVLFAILGLLPVMMRIAAFAANLTWIVALYFAKRFFRGPRPTAEAVAFPNPAKVNL